MQTRKDIFSYSNLKFFVRNMVTIGMNFKNFSTQVVFEIFLFPPAKHSKEKNTQLVDYNPFDK